jgi:hypothetical protein
MIIILIKGKMKSAKKLGIVEYSHIPPPKKKQTWWATL